jgi:hypothetical protein
MEIVINESLVKRYARIGQISSIAGLAVLAGGMFVNFRYPELIGLTLGALLLGFILSQLGIFYANRWGRRPRPDELITAALKGLDGHYTLYHYTTPTAHLLVGPAGVWVLVPRTQGGLIVYEKGRFRQKGGGFVRMYMNLFAQEGIGRPELDVQTEVEAVRKYLAERLAEENMPAIQPVLVFTNDRADLQLDEAPILSLAHKKLKEHIRKTAKSKPLSMPKVKAIQDALPHPNA